MAVKFYTTILRKPVQKPVEKKPLKFFFQTTLLELHGEGIKTFPAGTEYTVKLGKKCGWTITIYTVDGEDFEQT